MVEKYFLHRIQIENGTVTKGIEVHDTFDSARLSFWGRMKLGYNNPQHPNLVLVSCKITDMNGSIIKPYDDIWYKDMVENTTFFLHHIRKDGDTFNKDIDICEDEDAAKLAYAMNLEYGYSNPKFPNVEMVSCMITNINGFVVKSETWNKPEPEPEPEE